MTRRARLPGNNRWLPALKTCDLSPEGRLASAATACGDDRTAERQRVLLNAMLMTANGAIPLRIWDISAKFTESRDLT